MDIGLILAVTTQEPGLLTWFLWKALAWLGVAAGLTFVIFVHELGHFLVAKACGVKCEKFYVGFDFFEFRIPFTRWRIPRSLIKFQWGETEYGIGSLPLGGYVKMLGQDDDPRNAEHEATRIRTAAPGETPQHTSEALASGTSPEVAVAAKTVEGKTILLDPRSYPAKPVLARMAIISAGVIMNMIFAVVLAAAAFRLGVEEMPAIVGGVTPGGPAWEQGVEPGSKILQIGKSGKPYEQLRFSDLLPAAILNGTDRDLPILVRKPNGEETWYAIRPTDRLSKFEKRAMLGIAIPHSLEIADVPKAVAYRGPRPTVPLAKHDKLVEIAGQQVASGEEAGAVFAQNPLGSLAITVQRGANADHKNEAPPADSRPPQRLEVTLAARPLRDLGMAMRIGPIVAIREGSPADDAGFHLGDVILRINGEPVGDPLSLSQRLAAKNGASDPLTVVIARKDRQEQTVERTLTVTPEMPRQSPLELGATEVTSIESLGLAFTVKNEVAEVTPGGPADEAHIQAGDVLTRVDFPRGPNKAEEQELILLLGRYPAYEPIKLDAKGGSWIAVIDRLQWLRPENKARLTWTRGKEIMTAELTPRDSDTLFDASRGLTLKAQVEVHTAASVGEALRLGFRESAEQVKQVVTILQGLITRRLSPTNLSGPLGIISQAGTFASEGLSSLLIFLTILSANLAVLNFLPIPALDGGHMLFLAAEGIRGKPVDERLQLRLTIAGVICLLSLMAFATAMDLGRFAEMIQRWFS